MNKEKWYICRRKLQACGNSLVFYLFRIFPIKKNRIVICTFEGKGGFGCNPKYIVRELHKRMPKLEIIWVVEDMSKEFPSYIKKVPYSLWSRAYWMTTSKIWINNYRTKYGTKKREGQFYINTWHGMIGFKSIGLWRKKGFSKMAYLVSKSDSDIVDYFLCDSDFTEQFFPKGLVYKGKLIKSGSPRCDILLSDKRSYRDAFRKKYKLAEDVKCILYAPTFRESSTSGKRSVVAESFNIDFKRLLNNLSARFGGEWCLCMRMHPQIKCSVPHGVNGIKIVDVSNEDDMYEILVGMDALITDYSSCAMDAEMMHIPVFIYADDLGEYKSFRGDFVWEIDADSRGHVPLNREMFSKLDATLPFTIAKNNDELEYDILHFDENSYLADLEKYEKDVGLITDGHATERVVDEIIKHI